MHLNVNSYLKYNHRALGTPKNIAGAAATGRASVNCSLAISWLWQSDSKTFNTFKNILTCTVVSRQGTSATFSSTLHCVSLELHSVEQWGYYQVSDPSEVTPQLHRNHT